MGLSLKNFGKKLWDQVNVFDGGKSWSNPTAAPRPQGGAATYAQAGPQPGPSNRLYGGLAQNPAQMRAEQQAVQQEQAQRVASAEAAVHNADPIDAGVKRSITGSLQGVSGAYDWLTPGKGTNRWSKTLDERAKGIDASVAEKDKLAYKITQGAADLATFAAGGEVLDGAAMAAKAIPKVGKAVTAVTKPLVDVDKLATGGRMAQTAANVTRELTNPTNIANVAGGTVMDVGSESGKGRRVTPKQVGISAAMNTGMGVAVPAAKGLLKPTKAHGNITAETASGHTINLEKAKGSAKTKVQVFDQSGAKVSEKNIKMTDEEYRAAQEGERNKYAQPAWRKVTNAVAREVYDPRHIHQRLDDLQFKHEKEQGLTAEGQYEMDPTRSLAVQRGRIQNPGIAARQRDLEKVDGGNGKQYNLDDIAKYWGNSKGKTHADFDRYLQYKQELERREKGYPDSNGVDDQAMRQHIAQVDAAHPEAAAHAKALRAMELRNARHKVDARIESEESYNNIAQFEHYAPIERIRSEDLQDPGIEGGVRSGAKGIERRSETTGGPAETSIEKFYKSNQATEKALAEQRFGQELKRRVDAGTLSEKGYAHVKNAEVVKLHKQYAAEADRLRGEIELGRRTRDSVKREKGQVTTAQGKSKAAIKRAEDRLITRMDSMLSKAKNDGEEILTDVVRGPEYKQKLAAIKNQRLSHLTPTERRAQINQDMRDLNNEYPADHTRAEKLQLAHAVAKADQAISKGLDDASAAKGLNERQAQDLLHITDALRQARATVRDLGDAKSDQVAGFIDTVQKTGRGTQVYRYKLDGEIGEIEIPNDLARELAAANRAMNRNAVETGLRAFGDITKATWTGVLQPSFKIWNVLVKNPVLMFRNGDMASGINPANMRVLLGTVFKDSKYAARISEFKKHGMAYENALATKNIQSTTADDIAARANLDTFFERNPVHTLSDLWKGFNNVFASLDNAQRLAVAQGAFKRARNMGKSVEEAYAIGAQAPAKVFGDFDRVSRLAQNMEVIVPYSGSIQAGARSLARATRTKPIETTAKDALLVGGMLSLALTNMKNDGAREYYQDMKDSGKEYELDNNWTIVLPGQHPTKDDQGNWHGIIKIPLTPDFRPLNRATWQEVDRHINGQGASIGDAGLVAEELANFFTGDMKNSLYDSSRVNDANDHNVLNGVLSGNPALNYGKTAADVSTRTGEPLSDEWERTRDRTERAGDKTTAGAKNISRWTGGLLTPREYDQLFQQFGTVGKVLQGKGKSEVAGSLVKPITPGTSMTAKQEKGRDFGQGMSEAIKGIKDEKTYRDFIAMHTKNEHPGQLDSADKALNMLKNYDLYQAEKRLDAHDRKKGKPGNPLFDLPDDQVKRVLAYRQGKLYNATKQNRTKDNETAFVSFGLDQPWYDDFKKKENDFYTKLKADNPDKDDGFKTLTGADALTPGADLQAKMDAYNAMPKGSDKSAFLKANPDITDFWNKQAAETNDTRAAFGMTAIDNSYSGGSGRSSSGGGYTPNTGGYRNSKNEPTPEETTGAPANYKGASGLRNPYALQVKAPKGTFKKTKLHGPKATKAKVRKPGSGRAGRGRVAKNMPKKQGKVALRKAKI